MELKAVRFTKNEELANALSHFAGVFLAIAGLVLMIVFSVIKGNAWHIVTTSIYGSTLILLFFSSTMTHWLNPGKAKEFFFTLDQIAIFLLIAGTYTPISLIVLHGAMGWVIFGLEWFLAIFGIVLKLIKPTKYDNGVNLFYVLLYVFMGWMFIFAVIPFFKNMPIGGILWIIIGGIFYSVGVLFYTKARFNFHHLVWHLLVIGGAISHFIAIFFYVIPMKL